MSETRERRWEFLTNHAHVLVCIAEDPDIRGRDIADRVGVTERAVQVIIGDLVQAGYVVRERMGRRNHYLINIAGRLRHPLEDDYTVGELLAMLGRLSSADVISGPRAASQASPSSSSEATK